jgi:thiosulfate dehydrogenase [quinone] large subunit
MAVLTGTREGDTYVFRHHFPRSVFFWAAARVLLGFVFLWAFLDRMFAFGFPTGRVASGAIHKSVGWIYGGSPTYDFLAHQTSGPFTRVFGNLAGEAWVDWVFMISLLLIGVALVLGIGMRLASIGGGVLLLLMYLAAVPWARNDVSNPIVDANVIYLVLLFGLNEVDAGDKFGFGLRWRSTHLVERFPILR